MKIKIKAKKFTIRVKYKTFLSLISQTEIAAANNGNLIQARPLFKETSTRNEKKADIIEKKKKRKASLIQLILNQFHENFNIEKERNETAIITINKSFKDLLIIIIKGITDQIKIRNLSKIDFLFNKKKNCCVINFTPERFKLKTSYNL